MNSIFENTLSRRRLILPEDKIYIACSGGPDSVALFYLLLGLAPKWKLKLGLIHFNHKLRPNASRDARFVKTLAARHNVPFILGSAGVRKISKEENFSIEEAARKARYDFFVKAAKKIRIQTIALAHTQDDQAETVLMRMLQGTGPRGLCGIREQITLEGVAFVRPLLDFTKQELKNILRERRLEYCEDETNRSNKFLRNRIRQQLLPLLKRYNPRVVQALSRIPSAVCEEQEVMRQVEDASWKKLFRKRKLQNLYLNRSLFLKLPGALQFRALERALQKLDAKSGLSYDAWARLRPELSLRRTRHSLARNIDFILSPSQLKLYKK